VTRYLLDTNVMMALLRSRHLALEERIRAEAAEAVAISSIVAFELYYGAFNSGQVDRNQSISAPRLKRGALQSAPLTF
jgi:tRNA(fMet)-specific endonuclease VapC